MSSFPANAQTNINKLDCGKWKLVSNALTTLNLNPSLIKIVVVCFPGETEFVSLFQDDSNALRVVVPIAMILLLSLSWELIFFADSSDIKKFSSCNLDELLIASLDRGLNVPSPTAKLILQVENSFVIFSYKSLSKCKDAVGAAADSLNTSFANTLWYRTLSN